MRNLLFLPALIGAAAFAMQPSQTAGQPPAEPPVITTGTTEVLFDLIVRDKKGKPLTDLAPEEIKIFDDGVERKIRSMRLVSGAEAIERGAKIPLDMMRQIRLVTLAFQGMSDSGRRIAREAAQNLVKGDQAQNVFYSVVTIDRQLNVLQSFTTNKEALRKAIDLATSGKFATFAAESERIRAELKEIAGRAGSPEGQTAAPAPGTPEAGAAAGAAAIAKRTAEIMLEMTNFDASYSGEEGTRLSIFAMLSLVRGQYSMPGRKSILYFSEGMWRPPHLDEPFRNIVSAANRGNVTFYTVDARGVMTWSQNRSATEALGGAASDIGRDTTSLDGSVSKAQIMAADRAEQSGRNNTQLPLFELAEGTGGFLIGDANDLRPALKRVNEEVSSYYEITYDPGIQTFDGKFRKTRVEVSRKDTMVHARNGYFAIPLAVRGPVVAPYEFALLKALDAAPHPSAVDFRAGALRLDSDAAGISGLVIVEVPMSGIQFTEDPASKTFTSRVSLLALIKDEKGEVVKKLTTDLPRKGPLNLLPQARGGNFIYTQQVQLPPGKYTVETAVMDHEANKIGVHRSSLIAEARSGGVGISNLCLVRNYQPNAKDLDPKEPLQFQGGKITPTLGGQVFAVKGAQLSTFFIVHADPAIKEKPVASIEFLVDGTPIANADLPLPAPDAAGRIPYVMSAPAENMPAATYEIHVTVKQGSSKAEDRMKVVVASR
jgi:VWFA-related protein